MKNLAVILLIWISAGLFVSCDKNDAIAPPDSQRILFECYYINYAWGYVHQGFFIDNEEKIKTYSQQALGVNPNDVDWNFPDNDGNISEQALMENIQKTTVRDTLIDKNTLREYSDKIYLIDENDITEYQSAYDAGSIVYACYQYNGDTHTYKQMELLVNGDWTRINNNKYAKQISEWLKTIH